MVHVLYHSDKQVRSRLFTLVRSSERPLLVTGTRHAAHLSPVPAREPFASLERSLGHVMDQVVVADEGGVEGMWRDPVGDLAEALFPDEKNQAYRAASGYVLVHAGGPLAVLKKHATPAADVAAAQEALHQAGFPVPAPDRRARARRPGERPPPGPPRPAAPPTDPFALLGVSRGATLAEARKAYRARVAQYHPDKVAHLAPEFRELAERRTRELNAAWDAIQEELTSR